MLSRFKPIVATSAVKLAVAGAGAVIAVLFAHHFGQTGLGLYALARTVPSILTVVTDPGASHAVPYLINNRRHDRRTVLSVLTAGYLIIGLVQALIWLVLAQFLTPMMFETLNVQSVSLLALSVPALSFQILYVNMLRTNGRLGAANFVNSAVDLCTLALALVVIAAQVDDLNAIPAIHCVSSLAGAIAGAIMVRDHISLPKWAVAKPIAISALRFGIKSQIGNAFQILNYRLDHLLIGLFLSPDRIAIYFVATKAAELFRFFSASIVFVLEPVMASSSEEDAGRSTMKMMPPVLLINFALIVLGSVALTPFMGTIFGEWADQAVVPMYILALGLIISGGNSLFGAYYLGQGRPGVNTVASVFGLLVTCGLGLLLIPSLGVVGAAVTSSLTYAVVTAAYWVHFRFRR